MLLVNHGKTNAYGKAEYGCAIRHRDVVTCPIGALAFYIVWMFHVEQEEFFDVRFSQRVCINGKLNSEVNNVAKQFEKREDWYLKHVLHGGLTRNHEWDYNKHRRMYLKAFPKVKTAIMLTTCGLQ